MCFYISFPVWWYISWWSIIIYMYIYIYIYIEREREREREREYIQVFACGIWYCLAPRWYETKSSSNSLHSRTYCGGMSNHLLSSKRRGRDPSRWLYSLTRGSFTSKDACVNYDNVLWEQTLCSSPAFAGAREMQVVSKKLSHKKRKAVPHPHSKLYCIEKERPPCVFVPTRRLRGPIFNSWTREQNLLEPWTGHSANETVPSFRNHSLKDTKVDDPKRKPFSGRFGKGGKEEEEEEKKRKKVDSFQDVVDFVWFLKLGRSGLICLKTYCYCWREGKVGSVSGRPFDWFWLRFIS